MVSLFGCERMSGDCCSSYFPQGDPWFWPSWDLIKKGIMENRRSAWLFLRITLVCRPCQAYRKIQFPPFKSLRANEMEREIVDDVAFIISLSDLGKPVFNSKK